MDKSIFNKLSKIFDQGKEFIYSKNEIILRSDDVPQGVYLIENGFVRMYRTLEDGRELTFNIFKPGTFFPMMWVFGGLPNNYDFACMTQVKLKRLSKEVFLKNISTNTKIISDLTKRILIGMDGILTNIEYLLSGNAYHRVLSTLLISAKRFGEKDGSNKIKILLPLTHQDIANICGLTRETVSNTMVDLTHKKLISDKQKIITIIDMDKIEEEASIYKSETDGVTAL